MNCGLFFTLMRYIIGKNLPEDSEYNRDNPANFHDTPRFLRKGVLGRALQRAKQAARIIIQEEDHERKHIRTPTAPAGIVSVPGGSPGGIAVRSGTGRPEELQCQ